MKNSRDHRGSREHSGIREHCSIREHRDSRGWKSIIGNVNILLHISFVYSKVQKLLQIL